LCALVGAISIEDEQRLDRTQDLAGANAKQFLRDAQTAAATAVQACVALEADAAQALDELERRVRRA
jgi:hypothetical protein